MIKKTSLAGISLMLVMTAWGQNERKVIRDGIKSYDAGEYADAEVQFRKAGSINEDSYEAEFNTGTALYGQEKYEETVKQYESLLSQTEDAEKSARIWHNIGNSLLEAQQYAPSIEAYKNSLRRNPMDEDSRYNLAYAKQKLKEQQQQNQDQQQQDQQQNQDQQQQDQQQSQDQQQQDQDQQQQDQDQQQQDQQQNQDQQQADSREISREDAERMLQAIQQQEKDVKEKVEKQKAASAKVKTDKDW